MATMNLIGLFRASFGMCLHFLVYFQPRLEGAPPYLLLRKVFKRLDLGLYFGVSIWSKRFNLIHSGSRDVSPRGVACQVSRRFHFS